MLRGMSILIVTLVLYQLLLLSIGWWASRRTSDNEDFYLGGRKLGAAVAALSASASSSSAWSLLGVSGAAYAWGLPAIWLIPSTLLGFFINWFWVAPRMWQQSREHNALTLTEFLAGPHGDPARKTIMRIGCSSHPVLIHLLCGSAVPGGWSHLCQCPEHGPNDSHCSRRHHCTGLCHARWFLGRQHHRQPARSVNGIKCRDIATDRIDCRGWPRCLVGQPQYRRALCHHFMDPPGKPGRRHRLRHRPGRNRPRVIPANPTLSTASWPWKTARPFQPHV